MTDITHADAETLLKWLREHTRRLEIAAWGAGGTWCVAAYIKGDAILERDSDLLAALRKLARIIQKENA